MTKFDGRLSLTQANIMYNNQLAECYTSRGNCYYYESNTLLEALSDFEQVLVLQVKTKGGPSVQVRVQTQARCRDRILKI